MKKIINILLCLGLLLQNFAFIPSVFADVVEPKIIITKLTQDDQELVLEDGIYQASSFEDVQLYLSVENGGTNGNYIIKTINEDNSNSSTSSYYNGYNSYLYLYADKEISNFTIKLCDDWECSKVYSTKSLKIKLVNYDLIQKGVIAITNISQAGKKITPEDGMIKLNDSQDVTMSFKGENLLADSNYTIRMDNEIQLKYLGSELEKGITLTYTPNTEKYFYPEYYFGNVFKNFKYFDGTDNIDVYFDIYTDNELGSYTSTLNYTNYQNIIINSTKVDYNKSYTFINSKYHNNKNTLMYKINGTNYQDKDYDISVLVNKDNASHYTKNIKVNGLLLNNGYSLELDKLNLVSGSVYNFEITVDGVTNKVSNVMYTDRIMNLESITQDDKALIKDGDIYLADNFEDISVQFVIDNYNNEKYYLKAINESNGNSSSSNYQTAYPFNISPQFGSEIGEFTFLLCDNYECNKIYASEKIKIKLTHFNEFEKQKIYFYNFRQGGKTITMDKSGNFIFNNKQNITFNVKGENLIKDAKYRVTAGWSSGDDVYTGSELEKGIEITYKMNHSNYFSLYFYVGSIYYNDYYYYDGNNYYKYGNDYYFNYQVREDKTIPTYDYKLAYKNHLDKDITFSDDMYSYFYVVNSNYHDSNNPLMLKIAGQNYQDKDYKIDISVSKNKKEVYTFSEFVNGLTLNKGYDLVLNNLALELENDNNQADGSYYTFDVLIDDVYTDFGAIYNSLGKSVSIDSYIIIDNDESNKILAYSGLSSSSVYELNSSLFNKSLKINYEAERFPNDETFKYIIEYGYFNQTGEDNGEYTYVKTLKQGNINGKALNNNGLSINYTNPNNYEKPVYRLTVKKGNEVAASISQIILKNNGPMLVTEKIIVDNQEITMNKFDRYIIPRNKDIDIKLSGVGYEDKDYIVNLCLYNYSNYNDTCKDITIKGKELNNGTAVIHFNNSISDSVNQFELYFNSKDDYSLRLSGYYQLTFADSVNLIELTPWKQYKYDTEDNVIKNIKKNTDTDELINNMEITDNGSAKIFDKEGLHEVSDKLGTGMIVKVFDAKNNLIKEVPIIVKGDTTGDGNISISDLVKVKKHLAGTSELSGVYEKAGDVTDTGEISITDLVKMSRDVAHIEAIN